MAALGPGCVKTRNDRVAVSKFQSIFGRFTPLQARRAKKFASDAPFSRQFPSFHTGGSTAVHPSRAEIGRSGGERSFAATERNADFRAVKPEQEASPFHRLPKFHHITLVRGGKIHLTRSWLVVYCIAS